MICRFWYVLEIAHIRTNNKVPANPRLKMSGVGQFSLLRKQELPEHCPRNNTAESIRRQADLS